jgi:hypothetical protein
MDVLSHGSLTAGKSSASRNIPSADTADRAEAHPQRRREGSRAVLLFYYYLPVACSLRYRSG